VLIKFLLEIHLRTTGCRLPYGITQCYLPPGTSERTRHMFAAIIKSVYFIVPSDAGMFEGELHRLHHKGPVATKLKKTTRLPSVGCNASSVSQTSIKAKDHPRAKKYTAAEYLGWLAADNDQQRYRDVCESDVWSVLFGWWWTFWAYYVN